MYHFLLAVFIGAASGQRLLTLPSVSARLGTNISPISVNNGLGDIGASIGFSGRNTVEEIAEAEWSSFKAIFNKTYNTQEEENYRREVFLENVDKVARFNQDYGTGKSTYVQKLNWYADMLHHEFNRMVNGFNRTARGQRGSDRMNKVKSSHFTGIANVGFPDRIDWRELGAVTAVKHQLTCAGCYAFSATGAIEGHYYRKTGQLVELSPQNLLDCTKPYGNDGCAGGQMNPSYQYVKENNGIDTEAAYSFEAHDGTCRYNPAGYGADDTGFVQIDEGDEKALEEAVAALGPVSVGIDASRPGFQFYSTGVYYDPMCKSDLDSINHAVLVVGFGDEPNGQKYWLVKNSYGPEWGIGGFIKMARFSNNHCGIATYASYPLM